MHRFEESVALSADPARVWAVLGDLAGVRAWVPGVTAVRVYGPRRVCVLEGGAVQDETISDYSEAGRSYRYDITGSPLPVRENRGRFSVQPDRGGARVVWQHEFELAVPQAEAQVVPMWQGAMRLCLENLRRVVENPAT